MGNRCFSIGVCGLAAMLGGAVRADASPLLADFIGVGRAEIVSIAGARTGTFYAGELNWNWASPTPAGLQDDFFTYCVDVIHNVTRRQSFEIGEMRDKPTPSPLVANGTLRAAWLFSEYAASIHLMAPGSGGNRHAAALQLAIWEVLYDTDFSLATAVGPGGFRVTSASAGVWSMANTYLGAVRAQGNALNANATWLDSTLTTGQDQMTVPEPGTLLVLTIGLAGWAALSYCVRVSWPRTAPPVLLGVWTLK